MAAVLCVLKAYSGPLKSLSLSSPYPLPLFPTLLILGRWTRKVRGVPKMSQTHDQPPMIQGLPATPGSLQARHGAVGLAALSPLCCCLPAGAMHRYPVWLAPANSCSAPLSLTLPECYLFCFLKDKRLPPAQLHWIHVQARGQS